MVCQSTGRLARRCLRARLRFRELLRLRSLRPSHLASKGEVAASLAADESGQMVVELAVIAPVMLAIALVVWNLFMYLEACARFDRVVPDIVMALAVSPAGSDAESGDQAHQVSAALAQAMEGLNVEVRVEAQAAWDSSSGVTFGFSFAPHLTRYLCTMSYAPWPSGISIAGVQVAVPATLDHARAFTVDRYRSGVVF